MLGHLLRTLCAPIAVHILYVRNQRLVAAINDLDWQLADTIGIYEWEAQHGQD